MITNDEMRYINAKVDNEHSVPYPGDDYSKDTLLELRNALYLYNAYYKDRKYEILFSNGDNLGFSISPANLSHMLGINYQYLRDCGIFDDLEWDDDKRTSYDLLNAIVENADDIITLNQLKNYSLFNFYRIKARIEVFSKFSNFSDFDFGCINYDSNIAEKQGYSTGMRSNKFLFVETTHPALPYYMMGISNGENNNQYIETLFPNQYPEKMFFKQVITMPSIISTTMPNNHLIKKASSFQKVKLARSLNSIATKYNATFSCFADYLISLEDNAINEENQKVLKLNSKDIKD